ncbi:MAG TPA: GIY-YIG nuclease family protein [Dissulfurispiraceae bacterium]|nr:GIY-YIG nuclease family protein [Dissulfurispiraceae bacterium]
MDKHYYVYLMTNRNNTVIYTGVTNDLKRRVYEHREKLVEGFTKKYNATKLVYFETFEDITYAISREKQIKGGSRVKKNELVKAVNPDWRDLYGEI